ncbi:LysR family transcriptional regulator [Litoreibacter roseus]|uniref:LysR family transcriptional regulator n=1 Tax=Litoreibacter roseus TaxID=2601869 RepID=A0A6N6JE91_9RHOB|nr:LysR family transcriptional regulator [Litoreibacter roseus]GFE64526.1 LysR family transcriptional regulator [Litoreibacter roseus]
MNISRSDLPLLVSLDTLLATRNVSRAAEKLGISQPALSTQLARLRDLFDDPLLVQSGRRMVPTPRAEALQNPLHQLLSDLGALIRDGIGFDAATSDRDFRIAAPDFLHAAITTKIMDRVATTAPNVRIAMIPGADVWTGMENDRIDLLITSVGTTPPEAIAQKLFDERFVAVQRKDHPRGTGPLDLDTFCSLTHVLIALNEAAFRGPVDEQLAKMGRSRQVVVSAAGFLMAPEVIARSNHIAVIPETVAMLFDHLLDRTAPPFDQPGFAVMMSHHPRRKGDMGLDWLKQQVKDALKPD